MPSALATALIVSASNPSRETSSNAAARITSRESATRGCGFAVLERGARPGILISRAIAASTRTVYGPAYRAIVRCTARRHNRRGTEEVCPAKQRFATSHGRIACDLPIAVHEGTIEDECC